MKDRSPIIPPCTKASAKPNIPVMAEIPVNVPRPPFPEVATSSYGSIINRRN